MKSDKPVSRWHPMSRWPIDPAAVIRLARVDIDYVKALEKIGIRRVENPVLMSIQEIAENMLAAAEEMIRNKKKGPPK